MIRLPIFLDTRKIMDVIGQRIREQRERLRITRYALAKRASVSTPYIAKLEDGRIQRPSYDLLHRIAGALEVDVSYLVGD